MINIIHWLSERKLLNLGIIAVYIIAIFGLHDVFVNLSIWVMERLTINFYDKVILSVAPVSYTHLTLPTKRIV